MAEQLFQTSIPFDEAKVKYVNTDEYKTLKEEAINFFIGKSGNIQLKYMPNLKTSQQLLHMNLR